MLFGDGDEVTISTEAKAVRFLLISGKPIGEPVAWYGPIVMNTQEELRRVRRARARDVPGSERRRMKPET